MRTAVLIAALLMPWSAAAQQWISPSGAVWMENGAGIGILRYGPAASPDVAVYINTTPPGEYIPQVWSNNAWGWIDLTAQVPEGTIEVSLAGLLSVLGGTVNDGCNLTVAFTSGDSGTDDPYILQAILNPSVVDSGGAPTGTGTRKPVFIKVALDDRRYFRFKPHWWTNSGDTTGYPIKCAYFIQLRVVGYVRRIL